MGEQEQTSHPQPSETDDVAIDFSHSLTEVDFDDKDEKNTEASKSEIIVEEVTITTDVMIPMTGWIDDRTFDPSNIRTPRAVNRSPISRTFTEDPSRHILLNQVLEQSTIINDAELNILDTPIHVPSLQTLPPLEVHKVDEDHFPTPVRKNTSVAFGDHVRVATVKHTYYSGHPTFKFYHIGFWIHNKIILICTVLAALCVLAFLSIVLATQYDTVVDRCDKPLRQIMISNISAVATFIAFLLIIAAVRVGRMYYNSMCSERLKKSKRASKTTSTDEKSPRPPKSPRVKETKTTFVLCTDDQYAGTPITPNKSTFEDQLITPKHKKSRKDVVTIEPLKTTFNQDYGRVQKQKMQKKAKRDKTFKVILVLVWLLIHLWCLVSLVYVIDVGTCITKEPILYFVNLSFFVLTALCCAGELVITIANI
ncbi:pyruvate dehydrogenase phosphatase regulatory subunit, mitochondrial [Acrasis kona]|uniref:Pyruvate dehydrogenase phosphatase regulatory subunit, mitochondrial n=1 Tax=Acrasis kona TaxID=1008807 RepID=A0AAW2YXN9_9EUKA